jgi:hypothetical protein
VHAVHLAVARSDRLFERRKPRERRVAVRVRAGGGVLKCLHDVVWRTELRVPAPEIDERFALLRCGRRYPREQRCEVLLWKAIEPVRALAHRAMLWQAYGMAMRALRRGDRGALSLLSLVRGAAAKEDRRVLRAAP